MPENLSAVNGGVRRVFCLFYFVAPLGAAEALQRCVSRGCWQGIGDMTQLTPAAKAIKVSTIATVRIEIRR